MTFSQRFEFSKVVYGGLCLMASSHAKLLLCNLWGQEDWFFLVSVLLTPSST